VPLQAFFLAKEIVPMALVDGAGPEIRDAALHDGLVLLRSARHPGCLTRIEGGGPLQYQHEVANLVG
jgi:hypothetical protein